MAAAPLPQPPAGAPPAATGSAPQGQPSPASGAGPGAASGLKQTIEEFRQVAMQIQMLAQKYPEASDICQQILPMLQKAMTQVAGNPARTPDTQAPPVGS